MSKPRYWMTFSPGREWEHTHEVEADIHEAACRKYYPDGGAPDRFEVRTAGGTPVVHFVSRADDKARHKALRDAEYHLGLAASALSSAAYATGGHPYADDLHEMAYDATRMAGECIGMDALTDPDE